MKKKLIFPVICFFILAACNNSGKQAASNTDTTNKMSSDTSSHMNMTSSNVPELPAIPEGAKVFFKSPRNGATVKSPFKVEMGVKDMKVDTAGPVVAGMGHHHLLIDDGDSVETGTVIPKDSTHLHFGKGQTETELKLAPGKHKLTLQFADGLHRSYGSKLSSTITVNVKK